MLREPKSGRNLQELSFPTIPHPTLVSLIGPLVRCVEILALTKFSTASPKKTVVVFGQDLAGRLRIKPRGTTGHFKWRRLNETLRVGATQQTPIADARLWSVGVFLFTCSLRSLSRSHSTD